MNRTFDKNAVLDAVWSIRAAIGIYWTARNMLAVVQGRGSCHPGAIKISSTSEFRKEQETIFLI